MKLATEAGQAIRARKDEKPNIEKGNRSWEVISISLNGVKMTGLLSTHWLYFEDDKQWYKLDMAKYNVGKEGIVLSKRATIPLTDEEKKARKKARRAARKAAKEEEDEEDEEE